MKIILNGVLLIIWMVLTIVLIISVIGIMMMDVAGKCNEWFDIPSKLLDK